MKQWFQACLRTLLPAMFAPFPRYAGRRMVLGLTIFLSIWIGVASAEPRRVLIVHSFGSASPPFTTHAIAFETELTEKLGERVDLDEISLDVARYADADTQEALVDYIRKRQAKWQPDLVVPIGSPAGIFVAQNRDRLFPETPVLYAGMDQRRLPADALQKNAAFVGEIFDVSGLVEDILQVAPATTNIAVVIGASPLEQYWAAAFRREFEPFTNRVSFTWLNDLSFDQMLERVSKLPPRSFIFLILLMRDATGVTHNADEALKRIHAVANAPVNSIFQHQLGLGIVGGRLYQAELEGVESAHIAIRILHGEPASSIPPKIVGPLSPQYDWRELQRWGISQANLPADSSIKFREPTFWEKHRWRIVGIVVFCCLQTTLIIVLAVNTLARRRAEREVHENEERMTLAAAAAEFGIWVWNVTSNQIWGSETWRRLFGFASDENVGFEKLFQRIHPEDRDTVEQEIKGAAVGQIDHLREYRIVLPDGTQRWIASRGRMQADATGTTYRMFGVAVEITERKKSESALRASEELNRVTFEQAAIGITHVGTDGRWLRMNDKFCAIVGYSRGELMKLSDSEITHPEDLEKEHLLRLQILSGEIKSYLLEKRYLRKDQSTAWVELAVSLVRTAAGEPVHFIAVVEDITERKQAEAELLRQRAELAHVARVSTMGELAASVAHELNQPLGAILANAEAAELFLEQKPPALDDLRATLADIRKDDERASEVIRRMRALLRKRELELQPIDINSVAEEALQLVSADATLRRISLAADLLPFLPKIAGDRVHLQQVLLNLILNGMDAMNGQARERRQIQVRTRLGGDDRVELAVIDSGHGIELDKLPRLFDAFYTTKPNGMGMGLSIARTIIEAHHGRIWAENNAAGGATFRILLPTIGERNLKDEAK